MEYQHNKMIQISKYPIKLIVAIIFIFTTIIGFGSCSKEEDNGTNLIRVLVEANTDSPVRLYGVGEYKTTQVGVVIRRNFENTFVLDKHKGLCVVARCEDPTTLIRIKVWVNNKFVKDVFGNSYVVSGDVIP